jgi:hypothetical protein
MHCTNRQHGYKTAIKAYLVAWCLIETIDSVICTLISKVTGISILTITDFQNVKMDILCDLPGLLVWTVFAWVLKKYSKHPPVKHK